MALAVNNILYLFKEDILVTVNARKERGKKIRQTTRSQLIKMRHFTFLSIQESTPWICI